VDTILKLPEHTRFCIGWHTL